MITRFLMAVVCVAGVMGALARAQDGPAVQEGGAAEALRTVAEASDYRRTARYDEVVAFLDQLAAASELVRVESMGQTVEGRSIPLAIIADPPVASAEEARESKKLVVLLFGNIHAGEVCGKEALLTLARELALWDERKLLKDLIVLVAPIYNADGNERFAPDNRPGQDGPEEMGVRANAQGLDLNRDWVKLEAPETRAFVRTLNEWDPAVIVDTHTTNGSLHRYTITYQGPKHPAGDRAVIEYVRDTMLPAITADLDERTEYGTFFYGNFADAHTTWRTYPAVPRYGAGYRGIRNRLTILSEAYSYAPFEDRVLGTLEFCRSVLHYSAENRGGIRELIEAADKRTLEAGADDEIALRVRAEAFEKKVAARGFEESRDDEGRRVAGAPKEYEVELVNDFVATLSVKRPAAYLYPARLTQVTENLLRHGIEVGELREDLELAAEVYQIEQWQRAPRSFEGHVTVMGVEATGSVRTVRAQAGWMVVPTGQKLGSLAAYLLEPQAEDGLVAWNLLDEELEALGESGEFPIVRMMEDLALLTRPARKLPEDRAERKPIVFEDVYDEGERPRLDGSPAGGIRWLDEKTLGHERDGRLWRIDAVTGRMEEVASADRGDVAGRLAEHPAIDEEAARNLARRHFRGGGFGGGDDEEEEESPRGVVFEHQNDLYHAAEDGSGVMRLTSTPQAEELHELSPDGAFVGFVRENDLWVVDIATQTERALTTGGRDDLRNGKADWVYYEELFGRSWKAWWWSPDSRSIAFLQTDASMVPSFMIIDDAEEPQNVETVRYPRPGEPNPQVRAGVAARAGGEPRWVDLSDYNVGEFLISHVGWTPDNSVRLYAQDRAQTWLDFLIVGSGGGRPERLFRETTGGWVESLGAPRYLEDGSFLITSERDGWQHLYLYDKKGRLVRRVTEGEWEVRSVHRVDEGEEDDGAGGWVYFSGTKDSHIGSNLYRAPLGGAGGDVERLTQEPGTHRVTLSPEAGWFIDSWSSFDSPQRAALRRIDGRFVRWLDTNPVHELEEYALGEARLVSIPTEEGPELEGSLLYPPDFDPQRKYPVWFMTYAGPHAPTVRDAWSSRLHDRMLAQMGIVVFRADPYPASGKGAASAWTAYQRLGERELSDIEQAIDWLCGHEYIDADRIGMSGHSYGGFMTAYALTHSDRFCAGIAGAAVTDWRLYDTIYTERYMRTPQDNPDGYRETSVVGAAEKLHGRLLILHGTMDDNVHMQNSTRLVRALQRAEKEFEMFVYPGLRHGIFGRHYNRLMVDFIRRTVLEGVQPADSAEPSEGERLLEREQGVTGPAVGAGR
jgi:dipeptidyl-peptidase-4